MASKKIEIGFVVAANSAKYRVTQLIDSETIVARRFDNGLSEKIKVDDVIILNQEDHHENELVSISDSAWKKAQSKFLIIKPLIELSNRTAKDVEDRAKEVGVHSATLYRWIKKYEKTGKTSALIPTRRTGGKGKSRLSDDVENILMDVIENFYLQPDRPSIPKTIRKVVSECKTDGLKPPGVNTIRARINSVKEKQRVKTRHGKREATEEFGPYPGKYSNGSFPLSVIQIDHTPLDLTVVDEINRLSIGRPWVTMAIDVCTRMVAGFYISLEKPSALSTGQCISHMVLPKNSRIAELDLQCSWPIMGIPSLIHVDNAKEFDGQMLERSCGEYRIDLHFRPLDKPNYGAHIERYLGTLNKEIHDLPGTTYSNVTEKSTYPAEDKATFTLSEIERWITVLICDVYHKKIHSELRDTPEAKFLYMLSGDNEQLGIGKPRLPCDSEIFTLDFLPFVKRTVQQHGVRINKINYYHDVLRTWIGAKDPERERYKRKFIFRYDPRDISKIFFFDPELERYYEIPYRNISAPRMTLWELRETQKSIEQKGLQNYDEDAVFAAYLRLQKIEDESVEKTKAQRRRDSRKRNASKATIVQNKPSIQTENLEISDEELDPFDDIEVD